VRRFSLSNGRSCTRLRSERCPRSLLSQVLRAGRHKYLTGFGYRLFVSWRLLQRSLSSSLALWVLVFVSEAKLGTDSLVVVLASTRSPHSLTIQRLGNQPLNTDKMGFIGQLPKDMKALR